MFVQILQTDRHFDNRIPDSLFNQKIVGEKKVMRRKLLRSGFFA